jgi:hypothetical protein
MEKLAKKALKIINNKCFKTQEMNYMEEYIPVAEALSQLEAYEQLDKTPKELFYMIHNKEIV